MFDQRVLRSHPNRFPFNYEKRKSTDVCCMIIGAIFALTMFIVACCMWNKGTVLSLGVGSFESNFYSFAQGGDGKAC